MEVALIWFARDFIEKYYLTLKEKNPVFPILIRECSGVEPKLYGRYGKGQPIIIGSAT